MAIAFSLIAILVAFAAIWRAYDVRLVLFATALAIGVVAGEPVRRHACVGRELPVGEAPERRLIVGLGVGEAHAPAGLRRHQH